ncbi:MAG: ATP-binding protein [Deltaproteobacteria bacterium]|nr:ATP-binding protein [Deltaproteobacteria bacterium]
MTFIDRKIDLAKILSHKSVLLLGPRRTGKSALIRNQFGAAKVYNLLRADEFQKLAARPQLIREALAAAPVDLVVIDEIQKLPVLMDEVHLMIEEMGQKFLLTGSSARKLRRTHTSLMAGRAKIQYLHPFVSAEIPEFDLDQVLLYGLLPPVYLSPDPEDELRSYVGEYLKEEIQAEALSRNIENFSRFLDHAAFTNAQLINFESVASDAQVPARTVREYYTVLEDTLIGRMLKPIAQIGSRKVVSKAKFYFFDTGVVHQLQKIRGLPELAPGYGDAFESFLFHELVSFLDYTNSRETLNFWRTSNGPEVDFIVSGRIAIEAKATKLVDTKDLKGLRALAKEEKMDRLIVVSRDPERRTVGNIEIWPYREFLRQLWAGSIV